MTFNRAEAADFAADPVSLPCSQCIGCRILKSQTWAMRCVHEAQMHDRNSFVTLTYSPEHLPPDGGLDHSHFQLFVKRLRKRIGSIKYFMCGEYGEDNLRPHFHMCVFGFDFSGDRSFHTERRGNRLYTSKLLSEVWGKGFCSVGDLTFDSAAYVARYTMKKLNSGITIESKRAFEDKYHRVDVDTGEWLLVEPEYCQMSRRPGLGSTWFTKYHGDVYPSDEVRLEGRRMRPPRYYDDKLDEEELASYKASRLLSLDKHSADLTPDRLAVRKEVLEAKLASCVRDI